jgi:hypothetical protein
MTVAELKQQLDKLPDDQIITLSQSNDALMFFIFACMVCFIIWVVGK